MASSNGAVQGWSRVKFSTIIRDLPSGVSVNGDDRPATDNEVGVLKVSSVSNGRFLPAQNKVVTGSELERVRMPVGRGDLLISRSNTFELVGASGMASADFPNLYLPDKLWKVVLKDETLDSPDWLLHVLNSSSVRKELKNVATGTSGSMKNISKPSFLSIRTLRPPLPEQQKIAAILSTWDRAIELTEKLIAAKQKRKQALMQQLLTGKVRFKEFTDPWLDVPLGTFVQEVRRQVAWDDNHLYRLASIRRHSQGMFDREALHGHEIKVKKLNQVHANDFLISNIQAAYGAMGIVPQEFHEAYISDQYTVLVPNDAGSFDIRFLGYLSETAWYRYEIIRACNGFFAERLRLLFYAKELLKRKILAPPTLAEQTRIADVLDSAVNEIRFAQGRLASLKQQKKGLMQQLLTGKVRVKVDAETEQV